MPEYRRELGDAGVCGRLCESSGRVRHGHLPLRLPSERATRRNSGRAAKCIIEGRNVTYKYIFSYVPGVTVGDHNERKKYVGEGETNEKFKQFHLKRDKTP